MCPAGRVAIRSTGWRRPWRPREALRSEQCREQGRFGEAQAGAALVAGADSRLGWAVQTCRPAGVPRQFAGLSTAAARRDATEWRCGVALVRVDLRSAAVGQRLEGSHADLRAGALCGVCGCHGPGLGARVGHLLWMPESPLSRA